MRVVLLAILTTKALNLSDNYLAGWETTCLERS